MLIVLFVIITEAFLVIFIMKDVYKYSITVQSVLSLVNSLIF
jgi:hypothetical protein